MDKTISLTRFYNYLASKDFKVLPLGRWKGVAYGDWDKGKNGFEIFVMNDWHAVPYNAKLPVINGMVTITTDCGINITYEFDNPNGT